MDRELSPEIIRRNRWKQYAKIASIPLVLLLALWIFSSLISRSISRNTLRTAVAEMGPLDAAITASGVVVPDFEQAITSPIQSRIDTVFLHSGDMVQAGQAILVLNMESIRLTYTRLLNELELLHNEKARRSLELLQQRQQLETEYGIKEMQTRLAASRLERERRLLAIGVSTKEGLEQAELNAAITNKELEQLSEKMKHHDVASQADFHGLDLRIKIQENTIDETRRQMALAEARTDRYGVVTWVNENVGASVNPGDVIARIADLSGFRVEAKISDVHAEKLVAGGPVRVRINDRDLSGRIASINPAVQNGVITFLVTLDNKADRVLRPNLRADVFVVTASKPNVLRVKNGPFYDGLMEHKVFVVQGNKAVRREATAGVSNFDYVELQGDIRPGDEVIISDMKSYINMSEISITD
ncbi:MAG: efflux RND transporter periplasmic adaptor subunit [Candidatus Zixiibacteriota bacterium]